MHHHKFRSFFLALILVLVCHIVLHSCAELRSRLTPRCPPRNRNNFHRLGKSRFYIRDKGQARKITRYVKVDRGTYVKAAWYVGHTRCGSAKQPLRMASDLNKITTNALIARGLEDAAERLNLDRPSYWIDGQFDKFINAYIWGNDSRNVVKYGNFYYQQPRPIGYGAHLGAENTGNIYGSDESYNKSSGTPQCLTFELPFKNLPDYGWQASWNERSCIGTNHRRVLCESTNPECEENTSKDPHVLTEAKEYYYTEGNWIFANRRFIVNWKPRLYDEAKAYCEKHKMEIFSPIPADECLIPYLKLWTPVLSTYNFWTSYKYFDKNHEFKDKNNKIIQKGASKKHDYDMRSGKGRAENVLDEFCVVYQWVYEFKNETRCMDNNCDWMSYILAPSNCNAYVGTICQHTNEDNTSEFILTVSNPIQTRVCDFSREWINNPQSAIDYTAVIEFGYKSSGFWRSTYKQTFGSKICGGKDRQMIDAETEYWKVDPGAVEFTYDYEETYWVIDEQLFENVGKDEELCSVSTVTSVSGGSKQEYKRELKKVNCNEWHFYLCESVI